MKSRIVHTKMWEDEYFSNLSRASKLLFIYLITNSRINLIGTFEISDRVIIFDTGLNSKELEDAKTELFPKVKFFNGWVYVLNAERLGGYKGGKNETAKENEWDKIPKDIINALVKGNHDRVSEKEDRVSGILDTPINHKSEIRKDKYASQDYFRTLKDSEEELEDLTNSFTCTKLQVLNKAEDFLDYCISNGKRYKNYKSALRNALSKDYGRRVTKDKIPKSTERYDRLGNVIGGEGK